MALAQTSNMQPPIAGLHTTAKYEEVKREFAKDETLAVILEGMSGSGKTQMGLQLARFIEQEVKKRRIHDCCSSYIHCMLNCSSEESFMNDLQDFCKNFKLDLNLTATDGFKVVYEALNKDPFDKHTKLFMFDDMTQQMKGRLTTTMLNRTVLTCLAFLQNGDSQFKLKWKFIVTTKQKLEDDIANFGQEALRFSINGFEKSETLHFFKGSELSTSVKEKIETLHDRLCGSPLALSIAKKDLGSKLEVQDISQYLQQVEEVATDLLLEDESGPDKNIIALIGRSLRQHLLMKSSSTRLPNPASLLRFISFYSERNITTEMLTSCMEVIDPKASTGSMQEAIRQFQSNLVSDFFATLVEDRLTIHQLVRTALRILCHKVDPSELQLNCRRAMTALCRCQDVDGRFHKKQQLRGSSYVDHILSLEEILQEQTEDRLNFCDDAMKIMRAELLSAVGYTYLKTRGKTSVQEGQKKLDYARDQVCMLVCGANFEKLKLDASKRVDELGLPERLGDQLYKGTMELKADLAYQEHVKKVQLFRRLTERDIKVLNIAAKKLKNDHLIEEDLKKMQEVGQALHDQLLAKVYASEMVASVFYLQSRVAGFLTQDICNDKLLNDCIMNARIARAIYSRVRKDHGIVILNSIIVYRSEELHLRLRLLENEPVTERLKEIFQEFEELSQESGKAYEYGLLRSDLGNDMYHKLHCKEGMLLVCGLLCKAGEQEYYDKGLQLIRECDSLAGTETGSKNLCLSNVKQFVAKFYANCGQDLSAVQSVIEAMRHLGTPKLEILDGRFTQLCKEMGKYVEPCRAVTLSGDDQQCLQDLVKLCVEANKAAEAQDILKVLQTPKSMEQPLTQRD